MNPSHDMHGEALHTALRMPGQLKQKAAPVDRAIHITSGDVTQARIPLPN
jgi:hypothetical protein